MFKKKPTVRMLPRRVAPPSTTATSTLVFLLLLHIDKGINRSKISRLSGPQIVGRSPTRLSASTKSTSLRTRQLKQAEKTQAQTPQQRPRQLQTSVQSAMPFSPRTLYPHASQRQLVRSSERSKARYTSVHTRGEKNGFCGSNSSTDLALMDVFTLLSIPCGIILVWCRCFILPSW